MPQKVENTPAKECSISAFIQGHKKQFCSNETIDGRVLQDLDSVHYLDVRFKRVCANHEISVYSSSYAQIMVSG